MPQCKTCNIPFEIHPEDQKILGYFNMSEPTLCSNEWPFAMNVISIVTSVD